MPSNFLKYLLNPSLILSLGLLLSCQPSGQQSGSSVVLKFPTAAQLSSKAQNMSLGAFDFSRACFAANITGNGIQNLPPTTCDVPTGVHSDFVAPGSSVSLSVPKGTARRLEIFSYLKNNASDPCPNSKNGFQGLDLTKIARIGQVNSFDVAASVENVSVEVMAPLNGVNAITQYALPLSCLPKTNVPSALIMAGRGKIAGGNFIVIGALGGQKNEVVLQNSQFKVQLSRREKK
jgi:hypothetical protein